MKAILYACSVEFSLSRTLVINLKATNGIFIITLWICMSAAKWRRERDSARNEKKQNTKINAAKALNRRDLNMHISFDILYTLGKFQTMPFIANANDLGQNGQRHRQIHAKMKTMYCTIISVIPLKTNEFSKNIFLFFSFRLKKMTTSNATTTPIQKNSHSERENASENTSQ